MRRAVAFVAVVLAAGCSFLLADELDDASGKGEDVGSSGADPTRPDGSEGPDVQPIEASVAEEAGNLLFREVGESCSAWQADRATFVMESGGMVGPSCRACATGTGPYLRRRGFPPAPGRYTFEGYVRDETDGGVRADISAINAAGAEITRSIRYWEGGVGWIRDEVSIDATDAAAALDVFVYFQSTRITCFSMDETRLYRSGN